MRYCKTLYINCKEKKHIPELHNSDVIRLDNRNFQAYGIFISLIGEVFFKAERLQSNNILDKPYSVSLVIPKIEKFKEEDVENNLTRIEYIVNNFVAPKNGIVISIYEAVENVKIITPFDFFVVWPFKKQWEKRKGNHKNYVTIQSIDSIKNNNNYNFERIEKTYNTILKELNNIGLDYKLVDYRMSIETVFDILLNTELFFSWSGGCYYLAGGLNVPTLGFGDGPLTQMNNFASLMPPGREFKDKILRTCWGESFMHPRRIVHYDKQKGIHQRAQSNTFNIGSVETKEEIQFLRDKLLCGNIL